MLNLAAGEGFWAYARALEGQTAVVALNTDVSPVTIEAPVDPIGLADGAALLDRLGSGVRLTVDGGKLRVTLSPMSSAVFTAP